MKIEDKTRNLASKIVGINNWIKNNPQVTDPNAYEIVTCNVEFAEVLSEYAKKYDSKDLEYIQHQNPEIYDCYSGIEEMDGLRDTKNHPFFQSKEANDLYTAIKRSQQDMTYDVPEDEQTKELKKELLCKSMSVPFYIWQVHRTEPEYEYDNDSEFNSMKAMLDIYKSEGNTEFVPQIEALFNVIEKNYKYSEMKNNQKHA